MQNFKDRIKTTHTLNQPIEILRAFRIALENHTTNAEWIEHKQRAEYANPWFSQENIDLSLNSWLEALTEENISTWLSKYTFPVNHSEQKVGIICAGNIPLVGMHDLFVGLMCGYKLQVKLASTDEILPKFWIQQAAKYETSIQRIEFGDQMKGIDLAVATGSNNSFRYFEYYFRDIPHLLRKNRNSVAVLLGDETEEDYLELGKDVFQYFGLGCRNVTKIFIPVGFDFKPMFDAWEKGFNTVVFHNKYANNYNYHKALLLMNLDPHIDAGYILLKERETLHSPVGMLNYQYYTKSEDVFISIEAMQNEIQCVVSNNHQFTNISLGKAQCPQLWDYADDFDTVEWMLKNRN